MTMRADMLDRLPRPTALLLVSSILQLTSARTVPKLPRKTPEPAATIPHRLLNVQPWPLRPTPPPGARLLAFRRRQLENNTICGYIGGDAALPATCGAGSHCVVDTEHNVVGCCPDGIGSCTTGVFTGCVDANSGPQTEVNPYIYSCTGSDVCYRNVFEGGYSQFGCGTASDLAATVLNSASGATGTLARPTVSVSLTDSVSTLAEPTTLGTISSSRTSSSTSTSSSSPSSSSSSSSSSASESSTSTSDSPTAATSGATAPSWTETSNYRTGAIVGGTIGGLAVLIALVALAFFFLRRRNANPAPTRPRHGLCGPLARGRGRLRDGTPGPAFYHDAPPQAPMAAAAYGPGVVPQHPADRSRLPPLATSSAPRMPFQNEPSPVEQHDPENPFAYGASVVSPSSYPPYSAGVASGLSDPSPMQHYPGPHSAFGSPYAAGGGLLNGLNPLLLNRGAERHLESDQIPLTSAPGGVGDREGGDLSYGYHAALGRIGEEEEEDDNGDERAARAWNARNPGFGGAGYSDRAPAGTALSSSSMGQYQQQEQPLGEGVREGGPTEGRPLWQQNRRQSRNLMWM
ncbi:hypothetical protein VTJ83DRAFT_4524 [Remersonia thermophila]|uniref:Uncharacterized protein n=1 Tax=Remersonia thermophila TaxID=72144 RepID=A0ABR4DA65_9PEZI